jgi:hypothetical protein
MMTRLIAGMVLLLSASAALPAPGILKDLPVQFVENRGQWPDGVRFAARKGTLSAVFEQHAIRVHDNRRAGDAVVLHFEKAAPASAVEGEAQQPGQHHYYVGNDAQR